jgi:hypothetical protein
MHIGRRTLLLSILGLIPGSGLEGQEELTLRLIPRIGLTNPDSYFYEEFANFADDEPVEWTTGSLGRAAYVGVALEAGYGDKGIYLRGELGRTFDGWLLVSHNYVRPRVLFEPPEIITTWLDVPTALTLATLQVVLPTRFEAYGISPYFLVGGGGKWYSFGEPTEENSVEAILPSDGFTAAAELGAGLTFSVRGVGLDVQARDVFNRYWGKNQHDFLFSGGLVWTLR